MDKLSNEDLQKIRNDPELKKIIDDHFKESEISGRKRLRSISIKYVIFLVIAYLLLTFLFKIHINLMLYALIGLVGFVFILGLILNIDKIGTCQKWTHK